MKNKKQNSDQRHPGGEGDSPIESHGPMYHQPHYGTPAYYGAAAYGGEPGGEEEEAGIDLLKLIRILLRRWLTVLIFLVIGGLGAFLYIQQATPVYRAASEMEMSVRRPKVINSQAIYRDESSSAQDSDAIINTRFAKFRSPAMETMAVEEYRKRHPADEIPRVQLVNYMRRNVGWSKDRKANIVRVFAESPDPKFAAQLVNTLSYCSGALMIQENQAQSDGAVQWLNAQVEERRAALDKVEKQLGEIRANVKIDSLTQRKDALGRALGEVAAEKSAVEIRLASRKTTYDFVLEINREKVDFEKLPTGLPKEVEFNALVAKWRTARDELNAAAEVYTDEHPDFQRMQSEVSHTRQDVLSFIEVSAVAVKNEIRLWERQLAQLEKRVGSMEEQAAALELKLLSGEQRLTSLERQRDAADDAYRAVLQRTEQARMSADETTAFINVIREAEIPRNPIRPRKLMVLALGLMIGTGLGVLMAFLMEYWADRIELVSDLKDLGLNIIGTIPTQKKVESRSALATIGLKDKFSHVFEIFCGINTLISSPRYKDRTNVMLVCSVMPGEGKTISACNMAISAAMNDTKTLLIDGDLRRPRLANVFEISDDHPSLLEWLSSSDDSLDFTHLVNSEVHPNLDIITSRPSRQINPAELMGRARLEELIDWAREHYDRVIIDSPPIGLVGDTQALANQADSVIIVSRLKQTKKRALKFALGRLIELDATVLGCIANDVPHSLSGMFQGGGDYSYGSGRNGSYKSYGQDEV